MNCKRLLHFTVIVGLWSFYAGNAGAWEGDPVCRMNDLPSVHVGTPVTLLAQNGAGDYDDIDIHGGDDGEDYEPEVPTPAPGAGQPYGDDGPEMDAPVSEPGGDRPYVDDVPDMEVPGPEDGSVYPGSLPEDQGFDPDAGPGGFDDGAPPLGREPYGDQEVYPNVDGEGPEGTIPDDNAREYDGEGPDDGGEFYEGPGEDLPPDGGDYDGEEEGRMGHDEYAPVKKHHKKSSKNKKKKRNIIRDLGLYVPPDFVIPDSTDDEPSGNIGGSVSKGPDGQGKSVGTSVAPVGGIGGSVK